MTVTGTQQRVYGKLHNYKGALLALIPVNYNFNYGCEDVHFSQYHVFPNFTLTLPSMQKIYRISVISSYTAHGEYKMTTDGDMIIFRQINEDTAANHITLNPVFVDDLLWVQNLDSTNGLEFYPSYINGCNSIYNAVLIGEANITSIITKKVTTIQFAVSDYWGYCHHGFIGYIAVDYIDNDFVQHSHDSGYGNGVCNYKRYGFTGREV